MIYGELIETLRASLLKHDTAEYRNVLLRPGQWGFLEVPSPLVQAAIDEMEKQPAMGEKLTPLAQIGVMLLIGASGVKL